ncbi:dihydrofolate reductase-like isoform X2 [Varroa jacobsoni]|uniref:dihydrofolate reductase n=1 Tax=Varroa destructor TaxID=109461 RepID=A0A7M7JYH4_VARDE|nr:dihydrofolate reductase-like [Varroa destructor]XP_022657530.1 dihydrofolate reductase-like [Varroa destructor]XP_022657531.1 dihydrofolate reductase-like [Varroa destructor]XP_022705873.1 dihydrofolate reductase-like isoform X2 [Varroa jacobsoni]XP_022705874.1 dihydrofolate reductase-like isoform X2 [Varroa jacobsoni]
MAVPPLCAIVAVCKASKGIGNKGSLPWGRSLPNEMKHFARVTTNTTDPDKCNAVVMGRRTWESIPENRRPLPRRINIVISSGLCQESVPEGVKVAKSFDEALEIAGTGCCKGQSRVERIFVIGGTQVYVDAMRHPAMDTVYLTEVLGQFECDTFLNIDTRKFTDIEDPAVTNEEQEENGIRYKYRVLKKIPQ